MKYFKTNTLLMLMAVGFFLQPAYSAIWSSTNVEYLYGWNWNKDMGKEEKAVITIEHASGFKYGDNFFFVDITHPLGDTANHEEVYGQWDPRFSLGKISGSSLAFGPIGDVLVTGELGYGANPLGFYQREYNYGIGLDIKAPWFAYLAINFWVHDTPYNDGMTFQISPYWGLPFKISNVGFMFEGFLDFIGDEGKTAPSMITQPRLLLDLGSLWKAEGNLFVGTEVDFWWNEFGFRHKHEAVPQLMVKWVF